MFSKILGLTLLVAFAQSQAPSSHGQATSYVTYNQAGGHGLAGSETLGGNLGGYTAPLVSSAPLAGYSTAGLSSLGLGNVGAPSYSLGGLGGYSGLSLGGSSGAAYSGHQEEHYAPPKYSFKYGVEDKHTGDIKQQEETRDGDVVKGVYSLHEPDGTILTVQYHADKKSGFNAVVQRQGHANHPQYVSSGHH